MSKVAAHEIVADVLRVQRDIGRMPTRMDYQRLGRFPGTTVTEIFGSYSLMLKASGLEYSRGKKNKQQIRKETHELLVKEVAERRIPNPPKLIHRLLCISDMHHPYGHPDTRAFIFALDDKYNFDHILIGGDEVDSHGQSFHDHDPDLPSAGHELDLAIKALEPFYKRFQNADVLESNHGSLVYRKGKHHGFPRHVLKSYRDILQAPEGWQWRETFTLQFNNGKRAIAHHGLSKNYLAAGQSSGMSFIQFHYHNELGVRYWSVAGELHWAMQCACLIDDTSAAMAYNKLTVGRPVIGCAGVLDGLPRPFPMLLDASGRWNGVVP